MVRWDRAQKLYSFTNRNNFPKGTGFMRVKSFRTASSVYSKYLTLLKIRSYLSLMMPSLGMSVVHVVAWGAKRAAPALRAAHARSASAAKPARCTRIYRMTWNYCLVWSQSTVQFDLCYSLSWTYILAGTKNNRASIDFWIMVTQLQEDSANINASCLMLQMLLNKDYKTTLQLCVFRNYF